jgi:hypothetical protein
MIDGFDDFDDEDLDADSPEITDTTGDALDHSHDWDDSAHIDDDHLEPDIHAELTHLDDSDAAEDAFHPEPDPHEVGVRHAEDNHSDSLGPESEHTLFGNQEFDHFDPHRDLGEDVVGTPEADMAHWHQQNYIDSCDVSCEEFILDAIGGRDYDEHDLVRESMVHGWYRPGSGTPQLHMGEILKEHGVPVRQEFGCSLHDLADRLEQGERVIVGIQPEAMEGRAVDDAPLAEYGGIPTQFASHAVQLIGVKALDSDHPVLILNDPGRPDGAGLMVPADVFERGWAPSGHFMTTTAIHDSVEHKGHDPVRFGGFYDENGTHHRPPANGARFGFREK